MNRTIAGALVTILCLMVNAAAEEMPLSEA